MKKRLLTAGLLLACAGSAPAMAGPTVSFDFSFTGFSGAFAWSNGDTTSANDPSSYLGVGMVNGITPLYDGTHADRNASGSQWIIGGTAALNGGTTATMVASTFPGIPNIVSFSPEANEAPSPDGSFVLGTLSFTNGAWFGGTANLPFELSFTVTSHSATPEFDNQMWTDSFVVVTNVASGNCSDPAVQANNADFVYASGAAFMGSLRVPEPFCAANSDVTQEGSAKIIGDFDALEPLRFADVQGEAFLSSSVTPGPLSTPEPSTWVMLTLGFIGIGIAGRRRLGVHAA